MFGIRRRIESETLRFLLAALEIIIITISSARAGTPYIYIRIVLWEIEWPLNVDSMADGNNLGNELRRFIERNDVGVATTLASRRRSRLIPSTFLLVAWRIFSNSLETSFRYSTEN